MSLLLPGQLDVKVFAKNWLSFFIWGTLLAVLGVLAIGFTTASTLLSIVILGFIILTGGIVVLVDTFTFWLHKGKSFYLHLIMGLLYVGVGLMLVYGPVGSAVSFTLLLGLFYTFVGFFRVIYSLTARLPKWGWGFFNGVVALVLGLLILSQWPSSGLYIIGLFVGIDLLFSGWAYIMASLGARAIVKG